MKKKKIHKIRESSAEYGSSEIVLYKASDGRTELEVNLKGETLWLSLNQIASLFGRDKSVISRHLSNIFKTNELERNSTVAFFATVQNESGRVVERQVEYFNLDAIISVGYRVNSKRGTQFRIWATNVLREHLVKGYTVNNRRLKELNQAIKLIADFAETRNLSGNEATALLNVVKDYSYALDLLDDYDHQRVKTADLSRIKAIPVTSDEARRIIGTLRGQFKAGDLFGREKDGSLPSSLENIMQTFDRRELYPSIEEKAANLLYFLVKNHHFVDGNKRIGAALFLWFLEKNKSLYRSDGSKRIPDNALVAITLMMAESDPKDKNILISVVVNLINKKQ
ncbi:MAG TPA: cytochrome C biogenesis protein CycH [Lentisphaeria bacterium]|nr:MAG: cytochrome C biogenesis protein CycH [Lentisphaerae bacterium GWF2_49_21]HBC85955.1 cytochrome C biogenesis protein CycH [Lentisphaeria bacterium]